MLGKLLKHEWIATVRRYGLFYLVLGAMTILAVIVHAIPIDNIFYKMGEGAFLVLYVLTLCGVIFCSTGMAVVRFYKNMVSDEGYLTFTLPAKVEHLVIAKLLVAFCWQIITIVLSILSLLCVFVVGHVEWSTFSEIVSFLTKEMGMALPLFFVMMLFSSLYQMLQYYLSIAIGQLFGNYKILASVIAFCAISFGLEILVVLIIVIVCGIAGFMDGGIYMTALSDVTPLYIISVLWMVLLAVIEYFVTCHLLKKKLNLN